MTESKDIMNGFPVASSSGEVQGKTMVKTLLIAAVTLCSAAALGQAAPSVSAQATPLQMADHPQHASYSSMAHENPIVGGGSETYSYERGERPLSEFGPVSEPVPLGDVARTYRKERVTAKKAGILLEKQGS